MNQRSFFFVLFLFISVVNVEAQNGIERVSKDRTFSLSSSYIANNDFENLAQLGFGGSFEFSYKLSGYQKKSPVYLMIPLEYNYFPGTASEASINILAYGWSLRHHFGKNKPVVPFVDYSLLLTQLREASIEGYIIGHQTRFGFGLNFGNESEKKYLSFVKLEYGYHNLPERGEKKTKHMHTINFRFGLRILKKNGIEQKVATL